MLIERGQSWYTELLRLSLSGSRDLQINPRNCIGTVLALNGHRKYFSMYHAKHPETVRGTKVCIKISWRFHETDWFYLIAATNQNDARFERSRSRSGSIPWYEWKRFGRFRRLWCGQWVGWENFIGGESFGRFEQLARSSIRRFDTSIFCKLLARFPNQIDCSLLMYRKQLELILRIDWFFKFKITVFTGTVWAMLSQLDFTSFVDLYSVWIFRSIWMFRPFVKCRCHINSMRYILS